VAQEDEVVGEIKTHEKIVERRVRSNVIRRRTSRVEIVPEAQPPTVEPPKVSVEGEAQPANAPATHPLPEEVEHPAIQKEEAPSEEAGSPEPISATPAPDQGEGERPVEEKPVLVEREGPRGARVLGRIDLKRGAEIEQTKAPGDSAAVKIEPESPSAKVLEKQGAIQGREETKDGAVEEEKKPAKGVRHKKRVVKRQDAFDPRERDFRSGRFPRKKRALPGKEQKKTEITVPKAIKRVVKISGAINVGDLAKNMGVKTGEVIKKLMEMGTMATINQLLDADTATLIASEFEFQVENVAFDAETALEVDHEARLLGVVLPEQFPLDWCGAGSRSSEPCARQFSRGS